MEQEITDKDGKPIEEYFHTDQLFKTYEVEDRFGTIMEVSPVLKTPKPKRPKVLKKRSDEDKMSFGEPTNFGSVINTEMNPTMKDSDIL